MDPDKFPLALSFDDVLLIPQYSELTSRSEVDLSTQITPHVKLKIPLISINMNTVTGEDMAIAIGRAGGLGFLPRFTSEEDQANMVHKVKRSGVLTAAAIGVRPGYLSRAEKLVKAGVDLLTIDVAHGHMLQTLNAVKQLKAKFPHIDLIAGVTATYEATYDLLQAGADSVRVGLGPGTVCTTRVVTGFGIPQITAVLESAKAAKKLHKTILSDGGTKNTGDIVKGLAAGAHAVVIGSQFAGCDEAPGDTVIVKGKKYKRYNGNTSIFEKKKHMSEIGSELNSNYLKHIEGISSLVPHRGSVIQVLENMVANIRSGFSYAGAKDLTAFHHNAKFIRITTKGHRESAPHDVISAE